jgi:hypothetical protein
MDARHLYVWGLVRVSEGHTTDQLFDAYLFEPLRMVVRKCRGDPVTQKLGAVYLPRVQDVISVVRVPEEYLCTNQSIRRPEPA